MSRILYVTDLDGTLLNTHDRINQESLAIINDLVKRGMLFTYATARSLVSASVVTQGLSMDIPIIAYNGAFIIHPSTGEILSKESFAREDMKQVIDVLDSFNIYPLVYSYVEGEEKVSWIVTEENEGIRRYLSGFVLYQIKKNCIKAICSILHALARGKNYSRCMIFFQTMRSFDVQFSRNFTDRSIGVRLCRLKLLRRRQYIN